MLGLLWFQVSQYTGRIHLYSCIPGIDSRPKPLFKNFRPEEVSLKLPPPKEVEKTAYTNINEDMSCQYALAEFLKQWSKLSAVERRKLIGKPLQLPLCVELSYLNENLNHDNGVCYLLFFCLWVCSQIISLSLVTYLWLCFNSLECIGVFLSGTAERQK